MERELQNDEILMVRENIRNMARSQWFALVRWLAGLSALIITISVSILTILKTVNSRIYPWSLLFFFLALIFLGLNIFISFRLHKRGIDYYIGLTYPEIQSMDRTNEIKEVEKRERRSTVTFTIGFILFAVFIILHLLKL
ncbi:MAG: hypothetical protein JSV25_04935 [Spirochaetota bacterium]|nr:MAG: hypothetical protein JSV25_04935 [Spirochaetota bacterium]